MEENNNSNDYIEINRKSWNQRVVPHLESEFYDISGFLSGNSSLQSIEVELLGDLSGKSVLHLQCHFGQDSISMSRMGAKVVGVDLSDEAIKAAEELALKAKSDTRFVCCDIYDLPNHLNETFDIVFTSYGTIGWLPDLDRWAAVIARYIKPGGKFVFVEFHPVVWMYDDHFAAISYDYFNTGEIKETTQGTYADPDSDIMITSVGWNHSLSAVVNSLIRHGLKIQLLEEYDYSPYNIFPDAVMVEPGKYRIGHLKHTIPMVYSIVATK